MIRPLRFCSDFCITYIKEITTFQPEQGSILDSECTRVHLLQGCDADQPCMLCGWEFAQSYIIAC